MSEKNMAHTESLSNTVSLCKSMYDPMGIVLVGSSSREYGDALSDLDLEVIVEDSCYQAIESSEGITKNIDGKIDIFVISKSSFLKKKSAFSDIEHWPYEECKILYDKDGLIKAEIEKIKSISENLLVAKLKVYYFNLLFSTNRLEKTIRRGNELNSRLLGSQIVNLTVKILFTLSRRWSPLSHWVSHNLKSINVGEKLEPILLGLMREPNTRLCQRLLKEVEELLKNNNLRFYANKSELLADVFRSENFQVRDACGIW